MEVRERFFKDKYKDQRVGNLLLTGNCHLGDYRKKTNTKLECICDCGNIVFKELSSLRRGSIKTCSINCPYCTKRIHNHIKRVNGIKKTTKEYMSWRNMKLSCTCKTSKMYKNVGAVGITYCGEFETFKGFIDIIGLAPSKYHRLTRIDKQGDYEPDNIEWKLSDNKRKINKCL